MRNMDLTTINTDIYYSDTTENNHLFYESAQEAYKNMLPIYDELEYLREENKNLRGNISELRYKVESLLNRIEDMEYHFHKDATFVKLSKKDKMFEGILGDMLEEEDDKI